MQGNHTLPLDGRYRPGVPVSFLRRSLKAAFSFIKFKAALPLSTKRRRGRLKWDHTREMISQGSLWADSGPPAFGQLVSGSGPLPFDLLHMPRKGT